MRRKNTCRASTMAVAGLLALSACASGDPKSVGPVPTAPSTTLEPTTTTAPAPTTSQAVASTVAPRVTTSTVAPRPTTPPTTARSGPAVAVVDSGSTPGGRWQLVAETGARAGVVCAVLRGPFQSGGGVCNEASEQDFNGDETLRYSAAAGDGAFVIGVSRPNVATVRMEVRDGATVERSTVAAPFTTAARFVALQRPAGATIRSLTALDSGGNVLTRITINP